VFSASNLVWLGSNESIVYCVGFELISGANEIGMIFCEGCSGNAVTFGNDGNFDFSASAFHGDASASCIGGLSGDSILSFCYRSIEESALYI